MSDPLVTFSWPPVDGAPGYDLLKTSPGGVTHRSSSRRPVARFSVKNGDLIAVTAQKPVKPPLGDPLPVYDIILQPGWLSHQDAASANYQSIWIYPHSPTTPYRSPDSLKTMAQRYLLLDPRAQDADGRPGCDEWWFIIERFWPSDYPAENHGDWGRGFNGHNVAGDAGPGGDGGVGWASWSAGNSALALDWLRGVGAPSVNTEWVQSGGLSTPVPKPARDEWHTYVMHFVAGRTDGSTKRPGAITVWADGDPAPFLKRENVNTVQRAKAPNGQSYTQRWMQIWEGDYTRNLPVSARHRLVLTRVGRTLEEAIADRPVAAGSNSDLMYRGPNAPGSTPPSCAQTATRLSSEARIPEVA